MLFPLIVAHAPKPGAVYDPDGAGPAPELHECDLSRQMAQACEGYIALHGGGDQGPLLPDKPFAFQCPGSTSGERRKAAVKAAGATPAIAAELHVNSSTQPGNYALVLYDYRSERGGDAAWAVYAELAALLPHRIMIVPARPDDSLSGRAFSALSYAWAAPSTFSAVLVEPFFLNNPEHAHWSTPEGLVAIGQAIARGLLTFESTSEG